MKSAIQGLALAMLLLFVNASPAKATIDYIMDDSVCLYHCSPRSPYPVLRGHESTVTLVGQFVDLSTKVEVSGSGVYVNNIGTASGSKTIQFEVLNDAAPGPRTVKLRYLVEASGPDSFTIVVLQTGSISSVNVPTPTKPFTDLYIAITGNSINNAAVFCQPFGADCSLGASSSYSITNNTSTQASVHFQFLLGPLVRVAGAIRLGDKAGGNACGFDARYCYKRSDGGADIPVSAVGPNFVTFINVARLIEGNVSTPPGYSPIREGDVMALSIRLKEAAKSGGEIVSWQLVPGTSFAAVPGSGMIVNPSGLNTATVPAGSSYLTLTVRFTKAPQGCPAQGCPAEVYAKTAYQPDVVTSVIALFPAGQSPNFQPRRQNRFP
jgi:hypothetical protein